LGLLLTAVLGAASVRKSPANIKTNLLLLNAAEQAINLAVDSYPQALPNDGQSEAEISVTVTNGEEPLPNQTVRAEIVGGDGMLFISEATTNSDGVALFPYRAGLMPEKGQLNFSLVESDVDASLAIPLAPVTYMDVTLVTPEEYLAYLKRQAAAAPIYKLRADVFPDQLAADGGSMSTVWINLSHVDGKPAGGVPLLAEIISGEGSLETTDLITDIDGNTELHYIAGYTPGTVTIQISEPSTGLVSAADILLVEAGPARVQLFYTDPLTNTIAQEGAILPADGSTGLPMVAEVTDLRGIPLAGIELELSVLDTGNGWLEVLDPVSDIEGRVEFTYHAGTRPDRVRLRAFIADGMDYSLIGN